MRKAPAEPERHPADIDYRFSLANERTYLAWVRTSLALVAGGIAAAKALNFNSEWFRWMVAAPTILGGAFLGVDAAWRWRRCEHAMSTRAQLPVGRWLDAIGCSLPIYALIALIATAADRS